MYLSRELPGFVLNRLQYAVNGEAWRLVASGAVSAADVDAVMAHGLGARYAAAGPMLTMHTNAGGIEVLAARFFSTSDNVQLPFLIFLIASFFVTFTSRITRAGTGGLCSTSPPSLAVGRPLLGG